ncbi:MAG: glutamine-hydrolyzing carbamoyl-phosphate synthase small subunit [Christensenellaceae bacterium]|nr:glutamine-hydrolyzing carbamoyl-phosphate synthase small subunit [Christensenellaceae bacterium]
MKKGYLLLANGQLYEGTLMGAEKSVMAELVFTTAMTGYLETLTDPSYEGQIVIQTFPTIGNYGVIPPDFESRAPKLSGYIAREICDEPCNFRNEGRLNDWLVAQGIPCLTGVDTRALTRTIRNAGVMNAALLTEKPDDIGALAEQLKALPFHPSIQDVTCEGIQQARTEGEYRVALWDFGAKENIQRELEKRGCAVTVVPASATAKDILALNPDGLMLSNGPGDPADNTEVIRNLQELMRHGLPTFGICLGHQLLALSQGAKTVKLKYGHRGANQPARDVKTGLSYMTSQNHGFAVDIDTLPAGASLRFVNGNDGTCEGIDYTEMPAFSVQFHPEACGGPLDTRFLFDRFIAMMGGNKHAAES